MKGLTTTKATFRDNEIAVCSDRFGSDSVFCCSSSFVGQRKEDTWFLSQGEANANERCDIDTKLGIVPSTEGVAMVEGDDGVTYPCLKQLCRILARDGGDSLFSSGIL